MKSKQIILIVIISIFHQVSYAQFKVLPSGSVGIGTNNPSGKFQVAGNSYFSNSAGSIRLDGGSTNPIIGSSTDMLFIWYNSSTNLNKVYAEKFKKGWPKNTKSTSIVNNTDALITIMELEPIIVKDSIGSESFDFTFESVDKNMAFVTEETPFGNVVDFYQFIPIIVSAIQKQQQKIEILQKVVYSQENEIITLKSNNNSQKLSEKDNDFVDDKPLLYDNVPNPFDTETVIKYYIPENSITASIFIYDLQGKEMKSFNISHKGNGSIIINASELYAGMFVYTLIVDNKIIDTKRMILTSN